MTTETMPPDSYTVALASLLERPASAVDPRIASVAITVPVDVRVGRYGSPRRCPLCHRKRVLYVIRLRADGLPWPALDAGVTSPRCAECFGIRP